MRILYITDCWTGLKDIFFDGAKEGRGMPAFIRPLKKISETEDVDIYIIHEIPNNPTINVTIEWAKRINVVGTYYYATDVFSRIKALLHINKEIKSILQKKNYDFIYAHGVVAQFAYYQIKKSKIRFGHRLYGTFMTSYLEEKGYLYTKFRHFLEHRVFTTPKEFLLITDDGSKADVYYEKVKKNKQRYKFFFLKNGIDYPLEIKAYDFTEMEQPYKLFYLARISRWKGQHRAIELLSKLCDNGIEIMLYFAGQIAEKDYFNELLELAKQKNVADRVCFLGAINQSEIEEYTKSSIASLAFYDITNLGNSFYDYMKYGGIVISMNDGSLDSVVKNGENGFLVNDMEEAKEVIVALLNNYEKQKNIRLSAIDTITKVMKSWDERIEEEVNLIRK